MLRKFRERIQSEEKGFTLIELLVVMLIIGILAAIALPVFLGQQEKGQDSSAKSDARNLVSHVESCYAETQDYQVCDDTTALTPTGIEWGSGTGQTIVTSSDADSFTVTATSKNSHQYRIIKTDGAYPAASRVCDTDKDLAAFANSTADDGGGCNDGAW